VIGGLGSVRGALVGALVIGEIESLGRALLSDLASFVLFGALALVLVWFARGLVPPAPLFLARAVAARGVAELEPVEPVPGGVVAAATVLEWGELAAYTAVYAPAGVRQPIAHIWWRDRRQLARVVLPTPVLGGRREGFRTYSRFTDLKSPVAGRYRVDVVTASGQLIGRLRFIVTP